MDQKVLEDLKREVALGYAGRTTYRWYLELFNGDYFALYDAILGRILPPELGIDALMMVDKDHLISYALYRSIDKLTAAIDVLTKNLQSVPCKG